MSPIRELLLSNWALGAMPKQQEYYTCPGRFRDVTSVEHDRIALIPRWFPGTGLYNRMLLGNSNRYRI